MKYDAIWMMVGEILLRTKASVKRPVSEIWFFSCRLILLSGLRKSFVLFMRIQAFLSSAFRLVHDHSLPRGFPGGSDGKEPASVQETRV